MKHTPFLALFFLGLVTACNNPSPGYARGVDLSHHNGVVDWDALEAAPLDFIYLKATEGTDWKDPAFQDHWRAASQRGYQIGAYHFYLLCYDGKAQADNFIQSVEVRSGTLPPAVDLEYAGNCTPNGPPEEVYAQLTLFTDALEAEYGQVPVIYTTERFYADWIDGRFERSPIWIRKIGDNPPALPNGRDWWMWQYSASEHIAGIEGKVDMNVRAGNFPN